MPHLNIKINRIPKLQRSTSNPILSLQITSGDTYSAVPTKLSNSSSFSMFRNFLIFLSNNFPT